MSQVLDVLLPEGVEFKLLVVFYDLVGNSRNSIGVEPGNQIQTMIDSNVRGNFVVVQADNIGNEELETTEVFKSSCAGGLFLFVQD